MDMARKMLILTKCCYNTFFVGQQVKSTLTQMTFTRQSQSPHKEKTILLFLEYLTTYTRQWFHSSAKLQPHDTKSHTLTLKQKEMGRLKPLWHFTAVVWKTGCIGTFILLSLLYCGHFGVEFRYFWRVQHCPMVIKCICDRRRRRKKNT